MSVDKIDRILRTGAGVEFSELYEAVAELVCELENHESGHRGGVLLLAEHNIITAFNRCEATTDAFDKLTDDYQGPDWNPVRKADNTQPTERSVSITAQSLDAALSSARGRHARRNDPGE